MQKHIAMYISWYISKIHKANCINQSVFLVKIQSLLPICRVWWKLLLYFLNQSENLQATRKGSDHTSRVSRLIWAFPFRISLECMFSLGTAQINRNEENVPLDMCDKWRFRSACIFTQFDQKRSLIRSEYSITSMARTRMARLPWMIRTQSLQIPSNSSRKQIFRDFFSYFIMELYVVYTH